MQLVQANSQTDGAKHRQNLYLIESCNAGYNSIEQFADNSDVNTFAPTDLFQYIPPSSTNGPMVIIRDVENLRMLVVCGGMKDYVGQPNNFQQAPAVINGWRQAMLPLHLPLEPFHTAAALCMPHTGLGHTTRTWREITLVGHSFGGATCIQLGALLWVAFPVAGRQIFTYGAPKSMTINQNSLIYGYCVEVRTASDPVCGLPYSYAESPVLALAAPPILSAIATRLRHPTDPYYVASSGEMTLTRSINPVIPRGDSSIQLVNWLAGTNMFGSPNHSLATYTRFIANTNPVGAHPPNGGVDWLRSGLQEIDTNTIEGGGGGGDDDQQPMNDLQVGQGPLAERPAASDIDVITPAKRRRMLQAQLQEMGVQNAQNAQAVITNFRATGNHEVGAAFASRTRYGVRMVTYGGEIYYVVRNRREQRKMVRELNAYLREVGML